MVLQHRLASFVSTKKRCLKNAILRPFTRLPINGAKHAYAITRLAKSLLLYKKHKGFPAAGMFDVAQFQLLVIHETAF